MTCSKNYTGMMRRLSSYSEEMVDVRMGNTFRRVTGRNRRLEMEEMRH